MKSVFSFLISLSLLSAFGQWKPLEWNGLLNLTTVHNFENQQTLAGLRYLPELQSGFQLDSQQSLDLLLSANIYGSSLYGPPQELSLQGDLQPYRAWLRYAAPRFELRLGLQKIDFGSASILRPLQWFNQIDPRDPLQLTNGVYALLGRYYFPNNANIWCWGLYGNEERRGLDLLPTASSTPEWGARLQYPLRSGELAVSYHHRLADAAGLSGMSSWRQVSEHRVALDGKWDLNIGIWGEMAYVHKERDIGILTDQLLWSSGADYTLGWGNGLYVLAEHLLAVSGRQVTQLSQSNHISALSLTYPLSLWDRLSAYSFYNWKADAFSFLINYEHQFNHFTAYIMAYYNSSSSLGIQENALVQTFQGPGMRLMLVYNH